MGDSAINRNRLFFLSISNIIGYLLGEIGGSINKKVVSAVKDSIIKHSNHRDVPAHFKFDFSFSLIKGYDHISNFRFTYNNYNEKQSFDKKIINAFNVLNYNYKTRYNTLKLKEIFNAIKVRDKHQTTFGMDWPIGSYPRLKIYLEELLISDSQKSRLNKISTISKIINFNGEDIITALKDYLISVIGIDFFCDSTYSIKIYNYSKHLSLGRYRDLLTWRQYAYFENFFEKFTKEKSAFYQIAYRFDKGGHLIPLKILKIYENNISDFSSSYKEIFNFLKCWNLRSHLNAIEDLIKICDKNDFVMYPCIISTDRKRNQGMNYKADLHFSIKHKSYV
ncbi:MAG: hypothetical protein Q8L26_00435 [Candidatus Omnitrophota bacterium]|nr:hypothetical protein [Candidatus Omnitrophota bacterium]